MKDCEFYNIFGHTATCKLGIAYMSSKFYDANDFSSKNNIWTENCDLNNCHYKRIKHLKKQIEILKKRVID